jgi:hypothetical protein
LWTLGQTSTSVILRAPCQHRVMLPPRGEPAG